MSAGAPSGRQQVRLVATREIRERTRARSFRIGTLVIAVLAAALVLLPRILPGSEDPSWTVATTGDVPTGLAEAVAAGSASASAEVALRDAGAGADPAALLEGGDVDAVLVDGDELVVDDGDDRLEALVAGAVAQARLAERLSDLGVDPADVEGPLTAAPLEVRDLDPAADEDAGGREALAFVGVIGLFVAIASYGGWVLTSVLEEKANRVVEIVLSAITPRQLLAGKVLGTGLVGLLQLLVVTVAVVAVAAASGSLPDLPSGVGPTAASLLLWFLLGFAFYAVGYAAAGSLVSRQEDAQSAVTPMISVVLLAYFTSIFFVVPDPGGTVARVISLLPPVAPLAMPARTAAGAVELWEVGLAVVLMVAATWLMITLAARVYSNAILRSGARVPVREALRRGRPAPGPGRVGA